MTEDGSPMYSLGFGLERIGLPAIRAPRITLALVVALSVFCALGIPRLETNHTLSELFASDTTEYRNYKTMSDRFPASEFDVLVIVEADNLMKPELLEEIRNLHLELQFAQAVEGILSIFSMRDPPGESDIPPPMIPAEIPHGAEFDRLADKVLNHPLISGKLLSDAGDGGGQLTLLIISLKDEILREQGLSPSIREIEQLAHEIIGPTGMRVQLAGAPVMQLEIRDAIRRDRLIYNGTGFVVGLLVCLAFFRRVKLVLVTSVCSGVSVLWALGLLGWIGLELNSFINVIPPLVMVIAFTDAMHMIFSIRRRLREGDDRFEATRHAVRTVGPACVLASVTTSIAFLSLMLTDSGLVRTFGLAAALATLLAVLAVLVLLPTLVVLLFKDEAEFAKTETKRHQAISALEGMCRRVADWLQLRYRATAVIGLGLVAVAAALHFQLEPRYRLSDQVPDSKQSISAAERLDEKLTGAHPVHVMLKWSEGETVTSPRVIKALAETHALLEKQASIGNVWSVETLNRWLIEAGKAGEGVLADYLGQLPEHLVARFVNKDANSALVTGRIPNLDAEDTVPVLRQLDGSLKDLRGAYPEIEFTVTGLSALAAIRSSDMIWQLSRGLMTAIVVVIILIGVAFRSVRVLVLSILPNIFPIVAAGAVLYLIGGGLEYASVIALTVAFGIAVDDTIHFLNRLHLEQQRLADLAGAVHETISRIGPVLVLTTLVLVIGLAATALSDLPAMRLFGQLFMTTLAAALLGDIFFLPAIILAGKRLFHKRF